MSLCVIRLMSARLKNCFRGRSNQVILSVTDFCSSYQLPFPSYHGIRCLAADSGKKMKLSGTVTKMKDCPVETDPYKLVNYCCGSNYFQEGEDVRIKPDNEYPDWLWTIDVGGSKRLDELELNSKEYWLKVRKLARQRKNTLYRLRTKVYKLF